MMRKKNKITLIQNLNDDEGFDYTRHGIKVQTKAKKKHRRSSGQDDILMLNTQRSRLSNTKSFLTLQTMTMKQAATHSKQFSFESSKTKTNIIQKSQTQTDEVNFIEKVMEPNNPDETSHSLAINNLAQSSALVKTNMRRKKKEINLKEMISKQKVNNLTKKFIDKLKRNNCQSEPVEYNGFEEEDSSSIWKWQGFSSPVPLDNVLGLATIIIVLFAIFEATLKLVFNQLKESSWFKSFDIISLLFFMIDIFYNSVTVKSQAGKKLKTLEEILQNYLETNLVIDVVNIGLIILDISLDAHVLLFFRLFVITKIPQSLQKLEKLEVSFIKNYYNQQYWSLVKVVLFNFCFAHVLAIFLTAMAKLDSSKNWHVNKDIVGQGWSSQYIWAYYWAVNIMLTVGFGDLSATNADEALCLIFIEIFSVMCLAYNINWIGTLISNIRSQDIQKSKNFKTFKQLSDKYGLPSELQWRISNYIEESVNIKKKFNLQEEKAFVQSLPGTMKKDYLKESNKSIFQELPFFSSLVDKTLYNLAEKIEMTISHPEQVLRRKDDDYNLLILREGQIGFTAKQRNCKFNDMVIDKVNIKANQKPFILGLQFLTRTKPQYQTRSLEYSVIYSLSYDELMSILQESTMDYLLFCQLRDKNKSIIDEFEVLPCQICKKERKHTKFTCPKLHYSPFLQMVIHKQNRRIKFLKNKRMEDYNPREKGDKINALKYNNQLLQILQEGMINISNVNNKQKKNTNPFIDQMNKLRKIKDYLGEEDKSVKVELETVKSASDIIKHQLDRYHKVDLFEDQLWGIACDKIKNYKEYFPEGNACNLEFNFRAQDRLAVLAKAKQDNKILRIGSYIPDEVSASIPSIKFTTPSQSLYDDNFDGDNDEVVEEDGEGTL